MPSDPVPQQGLSIAITGATGLVGSRLADALVARGHSVVGLTRGPARAASGRLRFATYDPLGATSIALALEGTDAVVHLAGHGLFDGRWNEERMRLIRTSRVEATQALVRGIALLTKKPTVLVSASAVGFYGPMDPDRTVDESGPAGDDFLAKVCQGWEAEARKAEALGLRVVVTRLGIVLAREGGAVKEMLLPFQMGVGGPIGNGRQVMSWIHRDDLVALLTACVEDARWSGVVNATAPEPVSSREFAKAMGRALHRPAILPTPGFALALLKGRVASILTAGQRVLPSAALRLGFPWRYPTIDAALQNLVGK